MKTTLTIEEKAKEYADRPVTAKTWGMHKSALIDAYIAGAKDALSNQWRSVEDELPNKPSWEPRLVFTSTNSKFDKLHKKNRKRK